MELFAICKTEKLARFRRFFTLFLAAFLGMLVGALILPMIRAGEIYEYQDTVDGVHLPDADVIVCLAGGRGRIAAAGDFWYRYNEASRRGESVRVPKLYISGMGPKADWGVFRRQLRSGVRDVIAPERVIIENESFNTEANALWFARHVKEKGWKRIVLVTSPYHMKRALMIFQRVLAGSGVQIETLSAFQEPFEPGEWRTSFHGVHVTLLEYFKWIYYRYFWKTAGQAGF